MTEDGGKTVIVGVKMDAQSKELLTWSLVKVAQPGDLVIALHVLPSNEIVDQNGKSSLLSLVKAFDSILGVYEGFCNLRQVHLKLKICRGSSIRKVLVREAASISSTALILGTATKHHTIRSSISVAKYCANNLPKDCSVLALRNGKVVFQRDATKDSKGPTNLQQNNMLEALQRSSTIYSKLNHGHQSTILKFDADPIQTIPDQHCSVCFPNSAFPDRSTLTINITDKPNGTIHHQDAMPLPLSQKLQLESSSLSFLVKELPEHGPGWPLLHRILSSSRKHSNASSSLDVSLAKWTDNSFSTPKICHHLEDNCVCKGVQSDTLVQVGTQTLSDSNNLPRKLECLYDKYSSTCRLFKFEELQSATSNFEPENLIGKGGSSQVYRGCLPDGKEIAVKIFKKLNEDVYKEFVMEIEIITSLHHKNIISLFGFCFEDRNLLLVYNLLPRGSLEENLHGINKDLAAFGSYERYKVALGVAKALYYLHNHSSQPVIHRDVKSSNILLSEYFEPQLSDFGYAIRASTSSHITCTDVAGTFGYLAPEYFMYGKVTDKIDVYAFGVVLLELLTGRRPISNDPPKSQESLVMWAKPILNGGKVSRFLDPCMGSNYNRDQIERMVLAATLCIKRAPRARPQMRLILKLLEGDVDVVKWARLQVSALDNIDGLDEEGLPQPDIQSHLNLALLDIEDDSLSIGSTEHVSLEEYLRGRWSRSLSFD
ncbi:protein kinase STUNTED [Silene latifolia]|uniref:protein kinase STUNTED n=1 Tax=Silene latifolia TaxID=37657 RepID=UPI003D76FD4F